MDINFRCPHCNQELAADSSAAGEALRCPTCDTEITVPTEDEDAVHPVNPIASSAAARVERHFSVPVRDAPAEVLIRKEEKRVEVADAGGRKRMRIRVIRHTDCVEVGRDRYEELVAEFLNQVGEENIISITPISYTHWDIGTQRLLTDYAIQVIYRS